MAERAPLPQDDGPGRTRRRRAEREGGDFELHQLRAFVALVEEGSVTAAARALKLSQSTVSETLAALERKLGTAVIQRRAGSREMVLTAVGQVLLPRARGLLTSVAETYAAVIQAAAEARAVLHLVANESVSTYVMPAVVAGLRTRWPNTRFTISVATCADVRRGLGDGTYDVGVTLQVPDGDLGEGRRRHVLVPAVPLIVFAAGADHPLAAAAAGGTRRASIPRRELAEFAVFVSDPAGEFYELVERFLSGDGGVPVADIRSAGSVEGVKRGVRADRRALGILPAYAVRDELEAGCLVALRVTPPAPRLQLVASLSTVVAAGVSREEPHPATVALMQEIKQRFGVVPQSA